MRKYIISEEVDCCQSESLELSYAQGNRGVYVDSAPLMHANYQQNVHPIPFGVHSILSELKNNKIKSPETMLYLTMNYLSKWSSHTTHCLTIIQLAELMGISESYISTMKRDSIHI